MKNEIGSRGGSKRFEVELEVQAEEEEWGRGGLSDENSPGMLPNEGLGERCLSLDEDEVLKDILAR